MSYRAESEELRCDGHGCNARRCTLGLGARKARAQAKKQAWFCVRPKGKLLDLCPACYNRHRREEPTAVKCPACSPGFAWVRNIDLLSAVELNRTHALGICKRRSGRLERTCSSCKRPMQVLARRGNWWHSDDRKAWEKVREHIQRGERSE